MTLEERWWQMATRPWTPDAIDEVSQVAHTEAEWDRAEAWWADLHAGGVLELGPRGWASVW